MGVVGFQNHLKGHMGVAYGEVLGQVGIISSVCVFQGGGWHLSKVLEGYLVWESFSKRIAPRFILFSEQECPWSFSHK